MNRCPYPSRGHGDDLTAGKKGGSGPASASTRTPQGRSRIGTGFMGKCFHPGTDILTSNGWAPVAKVARGDQVCSLNPATGEIEYVLVTATHDYDYCGDLLLVGGRSALQLVTANHKVFTSRGLVAADALPSRFHLANQGEWHGRDITTMEIEGKRFDAAGFLYFFGLWLGDGYVCHRKAQPYKQDFIGFNVKKQRKAEAIRSTCTRLGVRYSENQAANGYACFYIYDRALLAWLSPLGGSHSKHIPNWVFSLSPSLLEHLYRGLMETDGCQQGPQRQEVYCTVSDILADDVQRLALHTGRSATKTRRGERMSWGKLRFSWVLSVLPRGKQHIWMERDGRTDRLRPPAVVPVPYEGPVHCVTLERNHVLMSRYDGRMVWSGNSWDATGVAFDPETWRRAYPVLKPGGHLLAFGSPRTYHRLLVAIEDAGFEVRDSIMWVYGEGMPKCHDVAAAIDRLAGHGPRGRAIPVAGHAQPDGKPLSPNPVGPYRPRSAWAEAWAGWGTALKPGYEPIVVARRPFPGSVARNVLAYGTGALDIDGCRVAGGKDVPSSPSDPSKRQIYSGFSNRDPGTTSGWDPKIGRWPANLVLTHSYECRQVGQRVMDGYTINRFTDGAKPFGGGAGHPYSSTQAPRRWSLFTSAPRAARWQSWTARAGPR